MKQKWYKIGIAIFTGLLLCGCARTGGSYVTLTTESPTTENSATESPTTEPFSLPQETEALSDDDYDSSRNSSQIAPMGINATICDGIVYTFGLKYIRLDTETYEVSPLCDVLGCSHNTTSCESLSDHYSMRQNGKWIYYIDGSNIYRRDANSNVELVYTNTYSTEYSEKNLPLSYKPYSDIPEQSPQDLFNFIFLDRNTMLVQGVNYFFIYSLDTGKTGEMIETGDAAIDTFCTIDGQHVYYSDNNLETMLVDMETGVRRSLSQKAFRIKSDGERLWYGKADDAGTYYICSNNPDFSDEVLEVQADGNFQVCGKDIYYLDRESGSMMHLRDGRTEEAVNLQELGELIREEGYDYEIDSIADCGMAGDTVYLSLLCQTSGNGGSRSLWFSFQNGELRMFHEK